MIAVIISLLAVLRAALLIRKFTHKYENTELFWIPWWLVIAFVLGAKFL
jgi:hypothetical protein